MLQCWLKKLTGWCFRACPTISRFFELKPRFTVVLAAYLFGGTFLASCGVAIWWLLVFAPGAFLICNLKRGPVRFLLLLAGPWLFYAYFTMRADSVRQAAISRYEGAGCIEVVGIVRKVISVDVDHEKFLLDCSRVSGRKNSSDTGAVGTVVVCVSNIRAHREVGNVVTVKGYLHRLKSPKIPWDFDQRAFFMRDDAAFILWSSGEQSMFCAGRTGGGFTSCWSQAMDKFRADIQQLHSNTLGEERGNLLSSMVVGTAAVRVSNNVSDAFRILGLSHIIAASGFNLTVVTGVAWWLLRLITRNRWLICFASLSAVVAFCGVAGMSASVERAALMCSFVLLACALRRRCHLPATLALAAIVAMIYQPAVVNDVGFQLSYAATTGIVCGANLIATSIRSAKSAVGKFLIETVIVGLTAEASVLPIQLWYFWQVGPLSPVANLLITPMVPTITVIGFASSAAAVIPIHMVRAAAGVLDLLVSLPLDFVLKAVFWLASFNLRWATGPPEVSTVSLYYLGLVALFVSFRMKFPNVVLVRAFTLFCFVILLISLLRRPALPPQVLIFDRAGQVLIQSQCAVYRLNSRVSDSAACSEIDRETFAVNRLVKICAYFGVTRMRKADACTFASEISEPQSAPEPALSQSPAYSGLSHHRSGVFIRSNSSEQWRSIDLNQKPPQFAFLH